MYYITNPHTGPGQSPYLALRPGESQTLNLILSNFGPASTFTVKVASTTNSTGFTYYLYTNESGMATTQTLNMEEGEKTSVNLIVTAEELESSEANSLSLTVTIFDKSFIKRSNFLNIEAVESTRLQVNCQQIAFIIIMFHTCNILQEFSNTGKGIEEALSPTILLSCLLFGVLFY